MSDYVEVSLTQGQVAIVNAKYAHANELKWYAAFDPTYAGGGQFVAVRTVRKPDGRRTTQYLHRWIMEQELGRPLEHHEYVDHINHNTLDNRVENLRLVTNSQNRANSRRCSNNTSGFKGVSWEKKSQKWRATIEVNGRKRHLGYYDTREEAYAAYVKAAKEHFGEYAYTPGAEELEVVEGVYERAG